MTDKKLLIGLVGQKRQGKDTVAKFLTGAIFGDAGAVPSIEAFADSLKQWALEMNPMVGDTGEKLGTIVSAVGWDVAKEIPAVRKLLQDLGQTLRAIDTDYWVRDLETAMKDHRDRCHMIVTDVRFQNEADAVKRHGGKLIFISRKHSDVQAAREYGSVGALVKSYHTDLDPSEYGPLTIKCDYVLDNTGTLHDLQDRTLEILKQIRESN